MNEKRTQWAIALDSSFVVIPAIVGSSMAEYFSDGGLNQALYAGVLGLIFSVDAHTGKADFYTPKVDHGFEKDPSWRPSITVKDLIEDEESTQ
jgi:hypothetical protein